MITIAIRAGRKMPVNRERAPRGAGCRAGGEAVRELPNLDRIDFAETNQNDSNKYVPKKTAAEFWRDFDHKKQ
jgi:hypothetical protein